MGKIVFNESQERVLAADVNLCVTAGAGSGKTKTLVECILRFLERDPASRSVAGVLALTYTDKAAGEMRSRLAEGLRQRLRDAPDDALRRYWSEEIRNLAQSEIGTIHGYSYSLVRRAGWTLNLPAGLAVDRDEGGGDLLETLCDLLHEEDPDLMAILAQVPFSRDWGTSLTGWLAKVEGRMSEWGLDSLLSGPRPPEDGLRSAVAGLREAAGRERATAADQALNPRFMISNENGRGDLVREGLDGLIRLLSALEGGDPSAWEGLRPVAPLTEAWGLLDEKFRTAGYRKSKYNGDIKNLLSPLFTGVLDAAGHAAAWRTGSLLAALSGKLKDRAFRKRRDRGVLNFSDMLYLARKILRERTDVRREEHRRWKLIVVDEFQDTNRLQADTLALILQDPDSPPGPSGRAGAADPEPFSFSRLDWKEAPLAFRAFGDHKQSIYRFRGAEPAVMEGLEKKLREAGGRGAALSLDTNYRSAEALIGFYNAFFRDLMGDSYGLQKAYRKDGGSGPAVTAILIPRPEKSRAPAAAAEGPRNPAAAKDPMKAKASKASKAAAASKASAGDRGPQARRGSGAADVGNVTGPAGESPAEPLPDPPAEIVIQARALALYLKRLFAGEIQGAGGKAGAGCAERGKADPGPPRPGDCAILIRRKQFSDVFEAALREAGIPAHTVKGEDLFADPAVLGMVSFWLALCGVESDFNLAVALTSPLGPVSDAALELLCLSGGPGSREEGLTSRFLKGAPYPEGIPASELAAAGSLREIFLALRDLALRRPPGEIMELAAEERELVPRLFSSRPGGAPERVRGLQDVLDLVKGLAVFNREASASPADLVEDLAFSGARAGEGSPEGQGGGEERPVNEAEEKGAPDEGAVSKSAVNIMTIHRSKGLEFPVVLVPEADSEERERQQDILMDGEGIVAVKYRPEGETLTIRGGLYDKIKENDYREARAEHLRVLYVAATRARERLVLLGKASGGKSREDLADGWDAARLPSFGETGNSGEAGSAGREEAAPETVQSTPEAGEGGRGVKFEKAGWLQWLESWPRREGRVEFLEGGAELFPSAWDGDRWDSEAASLLAFREAEEKAGAADGAGAAPGAGTAAFAARGSGGKAAAEAGPQASLGLPRPGMLRPLPESRAWSGTVTRYAALVTGGAIGQRDLRRKTPSWALSEAPDPWEAAEDSASPDAERRLKAQEAAAASGIAGAEAGRAGPSGTAGLDAAAQGTLAHAVLEVTDFATDPAGYRKLAGEIAERLGLEASPGDLDRVAARAHRFQEGRIGAEVRLALATPGCIVWREWPFWLRLDQDEQGRGPVTLTGVVDLFYTFPGGGGRLVDYKHRRPADERAYLKQIELYSLALAKAGFFGEVTAELCYLAEGED
ncbi:MAG: UvrD-helicase domain-containing protein [Deltaproteobacteria bacterium]|jgi:ATP-dependent helicase/nuclease subunit A|nr:UvrD-helicase domain-containing protein [Deltaproteobacteria bacterium]